MEKYRIGTVIGVSGDRIDVFLNPTTDDDTSQGVPDNMCINCPTEKGPIPILIGQPGTFVQVAIPSGILLAIIVDIQMKESSFPSILEREAEAEESYLLEFPKRLISAIPIGTIDSSNKFERGTDVLPTINSDVYAATPDVINEIFESFAEGTFSIGKLSLLPEVDAKINLDAFLSRHAALIGQTGEGKSWTVASLLQKITSFPQSTIVLFDLHGEYKTAFGDYCEFIDASELEFPYWLMNFEELVDLMVDRSEHNAPNQVAKFRELVQKEKEEHEENQALGIPKITVDTPVYFNFQDIIDEFRRLDTERVPGSRAGQTRKGDYNGTFTRLLMRLDSQLNDKRYDLIFHPKTYNTSASMEQLFRKLLGEEPSNPKKITVIDISPIPFEVRNSVLSLIMRCLFDFAYWYRRVNEETYPIAIFCDEAHAYLNAEDTTSVASRLSAEKIAKEGRKYGISITVISQRPREVSATILSQCNTFLCLRITNPDDQSYVKNLLPDSIRGITSMFSALRRGECILMGDSVLMPTRIKIDEPNPKPSSEDTSFYKQWNKLHEEIDVEKVLDAWRKQELES
ncbi:MAG: ATP-binding protein [Candidatus Helarchaeota archaeon]